MVPANASQTNSNNKAIKMIIFQQALLFGKISERTRNTVAKFSEKTLSINESSHFNTSCNSNSKSLLIISVSINKYFTEVIREYLKNVNKDLAHIILYVRRGDTKSAYNFIQLGISDIIYHDSPESELESILEKFKNTNIPSNLKNEFKYMLKRK